MKIVKSRTHVPFQYVGVSGTMAASAISQVVSTTQGAIPAPVMTTTQKNAIGTPATGLMVFDSTLGRLESYSGVAWGGAVALQTTPGTQQTGGLNLSSASYMGSLMINALTAPTTVFEVADTVTTSPRGIMSSQYNNGTDGARLHLRKGRGTRATPTTVVTGDNLGRWVGSGYVGPNNTYLEMASIVFGTEGTISDGAGAGRLPTNIQFWTATNAAPSVLTERMRIDSSGRVGIGTASPGNAFVAIAGDTLIDYDLVKFQSTNSARWASVGFYDYLGAQKGSVGWGNVNADPAAYPGVVFLQSTAATDLVLGAGDAEKIRIKGMTGKVGIGTNDPAELLTLSGGSDMALRLINTSSASIVDLTSANPGGLDQFGVFGANDSLMAMTLASSGQVTQQGVIYQVFGLGTPVSSAYEVGRIGMGSTAQFGSLNLTLDTQKYGTGTLRDICIKAGGVLSATFNTGGQVVIDSQILLPNGSASTPALAFTTGTNYGLGFDGASTYFVNNGSKTSQVSPSGLELTNGKYLAWGIFGTGMDTGISRLSTGKLAVGNGTAGDYSGTLIAGNVGIGTTTFGTSAAKVLGMGAGTAPTTAPAGMAQMWPIALNGAGTTGFRFMNEAATTVYTMMGCSGTTAVSTGLGSIKMASATVGPTDNAGWLTTINNLGVVVYIPYWTTPSP